MSDEKDDSAKLMSGAFYHASSMHKLLEKAEKVKPGCSGCDEEGLDKTAEDYHKFMSEGYMRLAAEYDQMRSSKVH